jgi:hypothetical protein
MARVALLVVCLVTMLSIVSNLGAESGPVALAAKVETGLLRVDSECTTISSVGSGFLVGPRVMITARHVLVDEQGNGCRVTVTQQGSGAQATVVSSESWYTANKSDLGTTDLAIALLSKPLSGYAFRLATEPPSVGDKVVSMGYAYAEGLSVTSGSVQGLVRYGRVPVMEMRLLNDHGGSGGPILTLSGEVVGLTQRGVRASELVESIDLTRWTGGRPASLCTGVASKASSTLCGNARAGATRSSSTVYSGRRFAIRRPNGWQVTRAERNMGGYIDTTILDPANPAWLLRVDYTPGIAIRTPEAAAAPVIRSLERQPSYRQVSRRHVTFSGFQALRWEFTVRERGRLLRKVDIFFIDKSRTGWGVLFQAPAAQWSQAAPRLQASTATLRLT